MLTFVESLSLAGDRAKQNDDAHGFAGDCAWVIDGATDLDDAPLSGGRSDASWLAHVANSFFHAHAGAGDLRTLVRAASVAAREAYRGFPGAPPSERWKSPTASLLICLERDDQLFGLHLGDCRLFALGADGALLEGGAAPDAAASETKLAAEQADAHKPLLDRTQTIDTLRRMRAGLNAEGSAWTFCLDPHCADHAGMWTLKLHRPAHLLLTTDGFSALVDRYGVYDGASLVRAAISKGLQELGRELRAIETADPGGARHPRFKASDDATALLMRLA